ncbi:ion transporter [Nesterenkonia haasae]|uniref:ion transporter n=1 Tax=Nesterenkonia haasae TaxID=2587813 RepID=UPI001391EA29|nr:ion transporter [Nesterenkonia haasae]NDK30267.1 ion transporter [Nesterenkonia haasae]
MNSERSSHESAEHQKDSQSTRASEAARELADTARGEVSQERAQEIEERWERWLAWPVMIAALVSVPAVFLTLLDEPFEMIGHIGLWATSVVLVFETVVLFLVSPKKVAWLRQNWWLIGLTVLVIVGVVFSIGPMQILRLLRSVGALRVLRAKQVAKAGHSLQKTGTSRLWQRLGTILATLVVSAFVVVALVDPESPVRSFLDDLVGEEWAIATAIGVGVLLFAATYLLVRRPRDKEEGESASNAGS